MNAEIRRAWRRLAARYVEAPRSGCHTWHGPRHVRKGTGIASALGRRWHAHRFAWRAERGPIPYGLVILHRCGNPLCVRLSHLKLATRKKSGRLTGGTRS